ncbi:NADP-dependent 3-hydroxy acid dehydrogenase YdfG [Terrimicrobium sacchariphilum]|uniref:NADP-dependent 3-hydroxy acid dehydrogenase YdfG n=1 Tax=Terrimicrobium sacchariphilum TaxID=690879 RepID=A0A146GBX1_TERSA|nr:SDR family oxidoreductase [Terrimicrobium sacchariphilum]GAT34068.1 NADP-dependent 3-hydroxy acid dehydrogenase YdfG [Terrimicrobium sacchariphilum]
MSKESSKIEVARGWSVADIPSQAGRTAVVTGAGGIGYEIARALAGAGAEVIIASRNAERGEAAIAALRREMPRAAVRFELLDLASLRSVADFSARLLAGRARLDLLVNNAAVMNPPTRQVTEDGYEVQFGANYLGHFALTLWLMPLLAAGNTARVVTLSSIAARQGRIAFGDLQSERSYRPMKAYSQSKLACLMFALELQRRSEAGCWGVTSLAAHPGVARTNLIYNTSGPRSLFGLMRTALWFLFQPAPAGALPALYAATSPDAAGGAYYGPAGLAELRGEPASAMIPAPALDVETSARLWEISERLSGAFIPSPAAAR